MGKYDWLLLLAGVGVAAAVIWYYSQRQATTGEIVVVSDTEDTTEQQSLLGGSANCKLYIDDQLVTSWAKGQGIPVPSGPHTIRLEVYHPETGDLILALGPIEVNVPAGERVILSVSLTASAWVPSYAPIGRLR